MSTIYRWCNSDGVAPLPGYTWPAAVSGETQTAKKFAIQNLSDRILGQPTFANGVNLVHNTPVGTNGGYLQIRAGLDAATLSCPFTVAAAVSAGSGVWGATGLYGWVIVAEKTGLHTSPSLEVTFNVTAVGDSVAVSWDAVPTADNYKAYRTSTPGTYGATTLVYSGATPNFIDTGAAPTSGTPPVDNNTGGAGPTYGTPPSLVTTPLFLGASLKIGQQVFFWVNRVIDLSVNSLGNPYTSLRVPVEF